MKPSSLLLVALWFFSSPVSAQSLPGVVDEMLTWKPRRPLQSGYNVLFPWIEVSDVVLPPPSADAKERVFQACQARPELYPAALSYLPERAEVYRELVIHAGNCKEVRQYLQNLLPWLTDEYGEASSEPVRPEAEPLVLCENDKECDEPTYPAQDKGQGLQRLLEGKADASFVQELLENDRMEYSLQNTPAGEVAGIVACLKGHDELRQRVLQGSDSGAQRALLAGSLLTGQTLPEEFIAAAYRAPQLQSAALRYILNTRSAALRQLLPRDYLANRVLGFGGETFYPDEQGLLELVQGDPTSVALLLRRSESGYIWDLPEHRAAANIESIAVVAPEKGASSEIKSLRNYVEQEEVESWPDFVWPYDAREEYLLTVVTPHRSWRLRFELYPKELTKNHPYIRLSQQPYRYLVDRFETVGPWKALTD